MGPESATRHMWSDDNRLAATEYAHHDGATLTVLEDDWERDSEDAIIQAAMEYGWSKPDLVLCVEDPMIVDVTPYEVADTDCNVLENGCALLCYRVSHDELRAAIGDSR